MYRLAIFLFLFAPLFTIAQEYDKPVFPSLPWRMYHLDRQYYNHNSISPGDANKDGYDDYVVIHEGPDKVTILFHPGNLDDIYGEWEKVTISEGNNVEYAYFGDLDGDGNLDIAYANGGKADVNVLWGPEPSKVKDPSAWVDGGPIPASTKVTHYVFLETFDVNQDGAMDIVHGGRRHSSGNVNGLAWYEAPARQKDRRDLTKWKMHSIDPELLGGHGFVINDLDQDGDYDFVVGNADWDTPDHEDAIFWYENPGTESAAFRDPWPKHTIIKSQMFFAKNQIDVGDLNKDGKKDIVAQTDNYIYYMERQDGKNEWKTHKILKPELTRWVTRPIKLADLNNDGKLDIVGMTIHNYGYTPRDIASVFWMEYEGDTPGADNWDTHVIKYSDGVFSGYRFQGEKWDHMRFIDLDEDGDLDILGNCEEYYDPDRNTILGVVWFENPTIDRPKN